jgi:hypothetical protein
MLLGETFFLLSRLFRQKYSKMPINIPPTPTPTPTPIPACAPVDSPPLPVFGAGLDELFVEGEEVEGTKVVGVEEDGDVGIEEDEEDAPVVVWYPVIVVPLIDPHP